MNLARLLNQACQCATLDPERLHAELARDTSLQAAVSRLPQTHPHLFSNSVVFLSSTAWHAMAQAIDAIERVMALPAYEAHALAHAPSIARHAFGPKSVFMGYDFHVDASEDGFSPPKLIEINTNAGGALLSAALARSQRACCRPMTDGLQYNTRLDTLDQTWFDMFQNEWHLQRGDAHLRQIVIVDEAPQDQYLALEFEMFRQLFERHGVRAQVAAPGDLRWHDGKLWLTQRQGAEGAQRSPDETNIQADLSTVRPTEVQTEVPIDLVYNRLTDFDLSQPSQGPLREAYEQAAVVVTPHPRAHAFRANKRHLATLSNDALLSQWGVSPQDRQTLHETVPETLMCADQIAAGQQGALWAGRRRRFFKPVAGYGGKAAFRGDKITKRVWQEVLAGDFVAQDFAAPGERVLAVDGARTTLKFDVRAYTYEGKIQLLTARTYTGQTTNFRTPGGGFSPVLVVPELPELLRAPELVAQGGAPRPTPPVCACAAEDATPAATPQGPSIAVPSH